MEITAGLNEFGVPAFLIAAVVVIALATLALHLLFPPSKVNCSAKDVLPTTPSDAKSPTSRKRM